MITADGLSESIWVGAENLCNEIISYEPRSAAQGWKALGIALSEAAVETLADVSSACTPGVVDQEYAVRLKVAVGEPLLHVRAVDKVLRTHQIKITHLDGPHAGMEEFLPFRHLVVAWKDRRRFLHDEQNIERVRKLSSEQAERITLDAIQMVLEASGEPSLFMHSDGHLSRLPEVVHRLCSRSHIPGTWDIA